MAQRYETPQAFKQALEARVRRTAREIGVAMGRFRQRLLFDRFLARVFETLADSVIVKGGVALELRLERARTTRDVDLRVMGDPDGLLEAIQQAGRLDLGDYLSFIVVPDTVHPTIEGDGIVYDGQRFRAERRSLGTSTACPSGSMPPSAMC